MRHGQSNQNNITILLKLYLNSFFLIITTKISIRILVLVPSKFLRSAKTNNRQKQKKEALCFNFSSATREGQNMDLIIHVHIHIRQGECDPGCILSYYNLCVAEAFQSIQWSKIWMVLCTQVSCIFYCV